MKHTIILLSLIAIVGCDEQPQPPLPPPPDPTIRVERSEVANKASVAVYYSDHNINNGEAYAVLDTPEKLQKYKEQVKFLTMQLDEAEKRMKINEQDIKPDKPPR